MFFVKLDFVFIPYFMTKKNKVKLSIYFLREVKLSILNIKSRFIKKKKKNLKVNFSLCLSKKYMCIIMLVTGLQLVFGIVLGKNCIYIYIYIYTHIHMVRVMIRPHKVTQFLPQLDMCQVMNDKF